MAVAADFGSTPLIDKVIPGPIISADSHITEPPGTYLDRIDPAFRDRLSARVSEHVKVLRHKITDRGLVSPDTRLSDEVVVRLLIEHGIVTTADLGKLNDPAWCSRQEDLWWSRDG